MDVSRTLIPPSMSATLALDPFKEDEAIHLSVTVVSHATYPITILAYSTFLHLRDAQSRRMTPRSFHCDDLDSGTHVRLQNRVCGRWGSIRHKLEDSDSQYFHTLYPEVPYIFCGPCIVRHRELVPGHKYRLYVENKQVIKWWRQGTKVEVLAAPGQELPKHMLEPSGDPITLTNIEPVEFTVPLDWENIGASVGADVSAMAGSIPTGSTAPPLVTTTLSLDFSFGPEHSAPELSVFLTSHAQIPITIWIWPTILHMNVVQGRDGFTLTHLDTNTLIPAKEMFRRNQDGLIHPRDRYFHTLLPGQPYRFSASLRTPFMNQLEQRPGRYRVSVKDTEMLRCWKVGTREELIAPIGQKPFDNMYEASGEPITLVFEPIEFTIPACL